MMFKSAFGQGVVRLLENLTGRLRLGCGLKHLFADKDPDDLPGAFMKHFGIHLNFTHGGVHNIPATGPVVIVANHPYGILDSLVLAYLVSRVRCDYRFFAHNIFINFIHTKKYVIPLYFSDKMQDKKLNLESCTDAESFLKEQKGCVVIFPSGGVSTSRKLFGHPMDNRWKTYVARLVMKTQAHVVPIYFEGHNSRLFQIVSHISYSLRIGLFIREFVRKINTEVTLAVGAPLSYHRWASLGNDKIKLVQELYKTVYGMSSKPVKLFESDFVY